MPLSIAANPVVDHLTGVHTLSRFYDTLPREQATPFLETVRRELGLACTVSDDDLARIPRTGPVVVVANHPFGAAEGIVLARILGSVRTDVRVLANQLLGRIPELRDDFILVDPFHATPNATNIRGLRHALAHVARGGMLAVFPAGTVSHLQLDRMTVDDARWSPNIARLVRRTKATVLPVYFPGTNGPLFQLAGLLHPALRTALLPHALLDRRHTRMEMRIGRPIEWSRLAHLDDDDALILHLRRRTYVLRHRDAHAPHNAAAQHDAVPKPRGPRAPIAPPRPSRMLAREVSALPALASSGALDVFVASADRIPNVLQEIGRLRELTFRDAGEGTGNASDLDAFDSYYQHLFLWNRDREEVAGAYRLGVVAPILGKYGIGGLYTSTLFRYKAEFFRQLGRNAVELGRSWIRAEYQKSYAPLLLLWKGIGAFVVANPDACVLFGPASISNEYEASSRALMARYLTDDVHARDLAAHVRPRAPFRLPACERAADFDELQELLLEIENGRRGVPVLLRQYLNIGARVAALNVDRNFSDVLDALVVVDLRTTPDKTLARYLTAEGARAFRAHHQRS
ncbi:MAG: lysophospholipid acyltransferase family protein [Acidobacteria bacterium]|nr:lysophospholipid acyltransferase family protein [Acidobacteriota bacterium]MBV9475368.1 lysophospholipid acyltransferase family protein [Acidobacteriota bacterium]